MRGAGGVARDLLDVVKQYALGGREFSLIKIALDDGLHRFVVGSLDTQEVSVAVQSIWTVVQVGNMAGNHLLVAAGEMALGKMNDIGELKYLA